MTKKYKVSISQNTQNDLEHIFAYISGDSIANAKKFILEMEKKIHNLETYPERFTFIPENLYLQGSYRHMIHKKYRIIYRISGSHVYIMRIIHGSKLLDL